MPLHEASCVDWEAKATIPLGFFFFFLSVQDLQFLNEGICKAKRNKAGGKAKEEKLHV